MNSIKNIANNITGVNQLRSQIEQLRSQIEQLIHENDYLTRINTGLADRNAQLEEMKVWEDTNYENLTICRKQRNDCWSKLSVLQGPEVGILSSKAGGKSKRRKSHKRRKRTKRNNL